MFIERKNGPVDELNYELALKCCPESKTNEGYNLIDRNSIENFFI